MYSHNALRLEVSGIYQKNTKVLNNLKGKPVHITLQYTIRIISNHIKNTKKNIFKTVPWNENPIIKIFPLSLDNMTLLDIRK